MKTAGILLAAGRSERFGAPKLLALLGGRPLLLHAVDGFLGGGIGDVVVVAGPEREPIVSALGGRAVRVVVNPDPSRGMLSSVQAGLEAAGGGAGLVAVSPADIPGISSGVVARLLAAAASLPAGAVAVPVASGRRGHPVILSSGAAARVAGWPSSRMLSDLFRERHVSVLDVEGFGDEVLRDVDRPEDLREVNR